MTRLTDRSGFTLIEMLVASLLLGMLVTILTMVFNSSSIAWRTGKAGVSQLSLMRRQLSLAQNRADNLLPRIDTQSKSVVGLVAGAWHADGTVRARAVSRYQGDGFFTKPNFDSYRSDDASLNTAPPWQQLNNLGSLRYGSSHAYTVGVLSYGPDGKIDTDDDISTWPDEVE